MFFLVVSGPGLEVIKLEFILKLKIKHNDWLLADTINALYFEFEPVLKFYNLKAWSLSVGPGIVNDFRLGTVSQWWRVYGSNH